MEKSSRHAHPSAAMVDPEAEPQEKTYGYIKQPTNQPPVRGLATEKQISFAKSLAKKKGYDAEISPEMTVPEMARFIDHLKTLEDIK
jgi:hypothetical protein